MASGNPFSIGASAARANLVPGLIIQAMMIALVVAYYSWAPARVFYETLADAKGRWGYGFTFVSSIIAGSVLPVLFKIVLLQRGKARRGDWEEMFFLAVFWGIDGMIVDAMYRGQALLFGTHVDVPTVVKKVVVDMFIYNPVFAAPWTLLWYEWKNERYRPSRVHHVFTWKYYREHVIPALCATWAVWIPVVSAIYALPPLLQIPLFALALTFWVLMLAYITARKPGTEPEIAPVPLEG